MTPCRKVQMVLAQSSVLDQEGQDTKLIFLDELSLLVMFLTLRLSLALFSTSTLFARRIPSGVLLIDFGIISS